MESNLTLGIDEAGMGPVFGPLVVSGVLLDRACLNELGNIGIKDSKKFGSGMSAHGKRVNMWEKARRFVIKHKQVVITAEDLDSESMYSLHIKAVGKILQELLWERVSEVYIEQLGGMGRPAFLSKLGFWHGGFIYETKADEKYPQVSLASIKAKILRDEIVIKLCREAGSEYVSGYPNKNTENFLRSFFNKNFCLPRGTRRSRRWAPVTELAEKEKNKHIF